MLEDSLETCAAKCAGMLWGLNTGAERRIEEPLAFSVGVVGPADNGMYNLIGIGYDDNDAGVGIEAFEECRTGGGERAGRAQLVPNDGFFADSLRAKCLKFKDGYRHHNHTRGQRPLRSLIWID